MKKFSIISVGIVFGLLLSGIAMAQTQSIEQRGNLRQSLELKNQSIDNCEAVGRNLGKRIVNFEANMTKKVSQYQKIENKITALIGKLESEGYDVSAIKVDLVEFESKITKFENDYNNYLGGLEGTKEFTCNRSSAEFKAKLAISRGQLKVVHEDSVEIQTFWAKIIKPKIVELKTQKTVEDNTEMITATEGGI